MFFDLRYVTSVSPPKNTPSRGFDDTKSSNNPQQLDNANGTGPLLLVTRSQPRQKIHENPALRDLDKLNSNSCIYCISICSVHPTIFIIF